MSFNSDKLHVTCRESCEVGKDFLPRRYTLTHSDSTGELFLTIDCDYDKNQISSFYTRFMRDEVLAEWQENDEKYELHLYLHVSGGFVFGWAKLRYKIFKFHLPLVLKALIHGDQNLLDLFPQLNDSKILVHFNSEKNKYHKIKNYGTIKDYKVI
jgi:hypothetical protein